MRLGGYLCPAGLESGLFGVQGKHTQGVRLSTSRVLTSVLPPTPFLAGAMIQMSRSEGHFPHVRVTIIWPCFMVLAMMLFTLVVSPMPCPREEAQDFR